MITFKAIMRISVSLRLRLHQQLVHAPRVLAPAPSDAPPVVQAPPRGRKQQVPGNYGNFMICREMFRCFVFPNFSFGTAEAMEKLPEIVKYYDTPNQTEWVEVVLAFDPETIEYKVYKDKKLELQTTNKKFVTKLIMTEPNEKGSKTIEVNKKEGFECRISECNSIYSICTCASSTFHEVSGNKDKGAEGTILHGRQIINRAGIYNRAVVQLVVETNFWQSRPLY
ncbi:hypothetical protein CAEBREN_25038 [Caenorhabditis brenneri]|uniref:Uncharacterized protein n=1 Tax=Caenorhabditis brenneri TaxID=135651 RepID=G0PBQ3_CAEBE|nr:hypothetical protein CAEBREN_25038 [Caenorhabditis brenneri]